MAGPNPNPTTGPKDGPKEDKTVVAGSIAVAIVVILFAGWTIHFFKKIQSGTQQVNLDQGAQNDFNFTSVKEAQQQLQQSFQQSNAEYEAIRAEAGASDTGVQQNVEFQVSSGQEQDPFGIQ